MTSVHRPDDLSPRARALLEAYVREDRLPGSVRERVHRELFVGRSRVPPFVTIAFAAAAAVAIVLGIAHVRRPVARVAPHEANAASLHEGRGDTGRDARVRGVEGARSGGTTAELVDEPPSVGNQSEPAARSGQPSFSDSASHVRSKGAGDMRSRRQPGRRRAVDHEDPPADDPGAGQLAREQAALDDVRQALAARRIEDAQAALDRFRARFSRPQLDDEAIALETMLECQRAPERSSELLHEFLLRNRGSLFLHQVRSACVSR
jgi:hypothetical protein